MKLPLFDVWCIYSHYNAWNDSKLILIISHCTKAQDSEIQISNLLAVGWWMGDLVWQKHTDKHRSTQEIQHVIPVVSLVSVVFLSYMYIETEQLSMYQSLSMFTCTSLLFRMGQYLELDSGHVNNIYCLQIMNWPVRELISFIVFVAMEMFHINFELCTSEIH